MAILCPLYTNDIPSLELTKKDFTYIIGRSVPSDEKKINKIGLDDESAVISRQHASARYNMKTQELTVTDMMSSNGIFVGEKLERRLENNEVIHLKHGDKISFGGKRYRYKDEARGLVEQNPFVYTITIKDEIWDDAPDCVSCSICCNALVRPVTLECGHLFCDICLNRWTQQCVKPSCPKCRATYTVASVKKASADIVKMIEHIKELENSNRRRLKRQKN